MIQVHKFGEVVVLQFSSEADYNGLVHVLHRTHPQITEDGRAYIAITPKEFQDDPEAKEMIQACIARAKSGFRGWWDMEDSDFPLKYDGCYNCEATSIEEDGDWVIYECGAICRFPNTETDAINGERARVMAVCPVSLAEKVGETIAGERYRTVAENILPSPGAPKDPRPPR